MGFANTGSCDAYGFAVSTQLRCLRVASEPVPMVQRLSPQLAFILQRSARAVRPLAASAPFAAHHHHHLCPFAARRCVALALSVAQRGALSVLRSARHTVPLHASPALVSCRGCSAQRGGEAGRRSGRRVLNTLVSSSIAKAASPNPSVKRTCSGLRPPQAAYLTR